MKNPRSLVCRFVSMLALGCALLALAPAPQARAQKKMPPPVTLTPTLLEKAEKVIKRLAADAGAKAELDAINHEKELDPTVAESDDAMMKKYPKLAAVYQAAGLKPHEFVGALITMLVGGRYADAGTPADDKMTQANIDFIKANRDRVKAVVKAVIGEDR